MKLVTSDVMRQIDKTAIEKAGIPSIELMENAGRSLAQFISADIAIDLVDAVFSIFCGKGNNGGDGFVVARYLFLAGYEVQLYHLGTSEEFSEDSKLNYDLIKELDVPVQQIADIKDLPELLESDFIIDAIFGTGFSGNPKGISSELIDYINSQPQEIISIDIPSGLHASDGTYEGAVIDADYTITLAQPKYGLYISPGREIAGEVSIVPIGIPDDIVDSFKIYNNLITPEYVMMTLPERKPDGHKGTFGKLLLLAGSTGMTGASVLTAKASLRSGCGLVKIGCPQTTVPLIASSFVDATTYPLPDVAKKGCLAKRGLGEIRKIVSEHDALVIGPGIGRHFETKELICRLLLSLEKPTVIDADALHALNGELQILEDTQAELILTPHEKEFFNLTSIEVPKEIHARIETARKFAIEHQTILVLKGSPTLVAHYDGNVYLNQTGNNGMAVGGSGDVLSGIIGSLLAQGLEPLDSALCGVFIHGLAGDIASYELGERSMIASDMIDFLPEAFMMLS